jgi:hypothetical protein
MPAITPLLWFNDTPFPFPCETQQDVDSYKTGIRRSLSA